ncbi:MAG: hypothetical protein CMO74_14525 [Verrucomicrobiales bacterium]|nr:hypothetical protein [Verrucomicrobiales bacterium]|tara:strand:+ start:45751 stop:46296 length:546 start_codon:yes stop_codon:yes gene_type:complete
MNDLEDIKFSRMESEAEDPNSIRMYKSQLYQIAKCAQGLFELLQDGDVLEDWVQQRIMTSYDQIEEAFKFVEYEKLYPSAPAPELPSTDEEEQKNKNNFLSNEDKRYPTPSEGESGDGFMGRCITDPNMKQRYPEQSDRFMACMLIFNDAPEEATENPGEKFEDPMVKEEEAFDPQKPVLP